MLFFNSQFPRNMYRSFISCILSILVKSESAERSFSKLKIIKGFLRSKMTQDRVSALTLISIEQETV
jgi:hypothetical protein